MSTSVGLSHLAHSETLRRERRNLRDRLARTFLRSHPELVEDPGGEITDSIPEGTTEAAVRSIARHYHKMRKVREYLKENGDGLASSQ